MNRERSISPLGHGRFDLVREPPAPRSHPTSPKTQSYSYNNDQSGSNYRHHHASSSSYNSSTASHTDTATTATTAQTNLTSIPSTPPEALDPSTLEAQRALEAHPNWRAFGVGDKPPPREALAAVANIPIFDSVNRARTFASLHEQAPEQRNLILFIRHFYCGACQAFIRALTQDISPHEFFNLPKPTQITIIGCGNANLIEHYRNTTGCPFPIYADPSRLLFKGLGMSLTLKLGGQPQYMHDVSVPAVLKGFIKELRGMRMEERFQGGNMFQIGGEFLFEQGEVKWCHRMKNMRGHAEVEEIKRVLGMGW